MSDESSRSAQSPGQRRSDGAPLWWSALDRSDLPEDHEGAVPQTSWFPAEQSVRDVPGMSNLPTRRRAWLINLAPVVVALGVIMLGVGVDSPRNALTVGLLFGIPIALVALTATLAVRRLR